jgi:hypothetical protein
MEGTPRCHKIIRTTQSVYLVYEDFPGCPLADRLGPRRLTPKTGTSERT